MRYIKIYEHGTDWEYNKKYNAVKRFSSFIERQYLDFFETFLIGFGLPGSEIIYQKRNGILFTLHSSSSESWLRIQQHEKYIPNFIYLQFRCNFEYLDKSIFNQENHKNFVKYIESLIKEKSQKYIDESKKSLQDIKYADINMIHDGYYPIKTEDLNNICESGGRSDWFDQIEFDATTKYNL